MRLITLFVLLALPAACSGDPSPASAPSAAEAAGRASGSSGDPLQRAYERALRAEGG